MSEESEKDRIKGLIGELTFALDTTTQLLNKDLSAETVEDFRNRNRKLIDKAVNELSQ